MGAHGAIRGRLGHPRYDFDSLPSTMDEAHRLALAGVSEGACVTAATQTGGRGRAGRAWLSPRGGLYVSLVLRPARAVSDVPQLALVAGLAVAQTVAERTGLRPVIRWPNDVLLRGRKLAGILTEAKTGPAGLHVVVGIGLNAATPGAELPPIAVSLAEAGKPVDAATMADAILRQFETLYDRWLADGFAALRHDLLGWVNDFGHLVHITTPKDRFEGQAMDIDAQGRLLVRLDSGMIRVVDMGEVALLAHDDAGNGHEP